MKIELARLGKAGIKCELLSVLVFQGEAPKKGKTDETVAIFQALSDLDNKMSKSLLKNAQKEGFNAGLGKTCFTYTLGHLPADSIALVGLGPNRDQTLDVFRKASGETIKLAKAKRAATLALVIPEQTSLPLFDVVQALVEGCRLANYRYDRYHTVDKSDFAIKEITIYLTHEGIGEEAQAIERGNIITSGVMLARDLINEPPVTLTPESLSLTAKKTAKEAHLSIEVLDEKKLLQEKMGLMLAVGAASVDVAPPRLIKLSYKAAKAKKPTIVLIGKGVTFDSGGLDIKPADGMLDMKVDMSGAAAVLGVMKIIGALKPNCNVVGYMACVENGIGSKAYHPGDVITSRKGITVEISNTDAEGRLVLADTITYSLDHDNPDIIIDIATLTGACVVALGQKTAGIFSNNNELCEAIISSGLQNGESFWRLPLTKELRDGLKTPMADIKNCGDRWGGSITAALFLEEFVGSDVKWSHLDIAGPATNTKPHAYLPQGGVGFGVRTLVDFIMGQ
jgi:leucyl aminopeptidase